LRAAGVLAGRDGIEPLRTSAERLASSPVRLEHAWSLLELGAALHLGGFSLEAREPLAHARELAHLCGAERTLARATALLRASGGRPRRIARTGIEALTPSERRVAALAAEGYSNLEIAQQLIVSVKTVEAHLSRVYGKLALPSTEAPRQQLAEAFESVRR
jgi:DNA-binding CsgD family transcriptional regulator